MKLHNVEVQGTCHPLGTFNMDSDTAVVTDPCYDLGTWCQAKIENVLQGTWKGYLYRKPDEYALRFRDQDIERAKKELEDAKQLDLISDDLEELKANKDLLVLLERIKEFSFVKQVFSWIGVDICFVCIVCAICHCTHWFGGSWSNCVFYSMGYFFDSQ